jgi:integrase
VQGDLTSTKTGKERTVDLTPQFVAALRKLKLKNQKRGAWVFQNSNGNYVDMDNFRERDFRPTLIELGHPLVRVHDLRHRCATFLIRRTKDIYYAQQQLGHGSIGVTVDRYGHLLEENGETRLIDVLDDAAVL